MNSGLSARQARCGQIAASPLAFVRGLACGGLMAAAFAPLALRAQQPASTSGYDAPHRSNPLLPGYLADPSILRHDGKSLRGVENHEGVETVTRYPCSLIYERAPIGGEEDDHREGLVDLDRVPREAVAQIDAPRERGRDTKV